MQQTQILTNTSFHRKSQALKEGLTTGEEKEGGHLKRQKKHWRRHWQEWALAEAERLENRK